MARIDCFLTRIGKYAWYWNDCLRNIEGYLGVQGIQAPNYQEFHDFVEEKDAIKYAIERYGSMLEAHTKKFEEVGIHKISSEFWQTGDLILFTYQDKKIVHVAFVSESCELWTHTQNGFDPITPSDISIQGIYREQ